MEVVATLYRFGSPHWKDTELVFEKKGLIPAMQKLLVTYLTSYGFFRHSS